MTRPANLELPSRILDEAESIVAAEGYAALNLRTVARRVQVTATTIYHYYENKDDLLLQLKLRTAEKLNRRIDGIDPSLPPYEALLELAVEYIGFAEEHPHLYLLLIETQIGEDALSDSDRNVLYHTYYTARGFLERFPDREGGPGDPRYEAMMGWVMLHGFCSLLLSGSFQLVENVDRNTLKGLFLRFYGGEGGRKYKP